MGYGKFSQPGIPGGSTLIFEVYMIDKNVVKKLVEEWLQDKEYFLVSIEISPDDRIVVEIDHEIGRAHV